MMAGRSQHILLAICILLSSLAHAVTWTSIDVPGATATEALRLNKAGQIVGLYTDGAHHTHGFLDDAGTFTTIDVPGSSQTVARGINDSGIIAGFYSTATNDAVGFIFDGQTYTTIQFPGSQLTTANGINNAGEVVGWYGHGGSNPDFHGFKWANGVFTTIEVSPGETELVGINNRDYIVGFNAFSYDTYVISPNGASRTLTFQGGGIAAGVNDNNILVGYIEDPNFKLVLSIASATTRSRASITREH